MQPNDQQNRKVNSTFAVNKTDHRLNILSAGCDRESRVRVPLTQVIKAVILIPRFTKERIQSLDMCFRASNEMRFPSRLTIKRHFNDSEMTGLDLLPHQHTANLSAARRPERLS